MMRSWQVAGGSVRGTRHRQAERNNQDAMFWSCDDDALVMVVTDGCSSGAYSEAGALLGSRIFARRAAHAARQHAGSPAEQIARAVKNSAVAELSAVHQLLGPTDQALHDYLLFTAVVAIITPELTTVFVLGDGVAVLNGEVRVIESEANRPDYPAYEVREGALAIEPVVLWCCPTSEVQSLLIGTDGVSDLDRNDLARFWSDERYFSNPDQLRRLLALSNRETRRIDWQTRQVERSPGLLPDDTTLLVARRVPER